MDYRGWCRMKVQCPSCKKICHETTSAYDPDVIANGSMVSLIDPWKAWGWGTFGNECKASGVLASEMFCPSCDGVLAPGGRLTVVEDNQEMAATTHSCYGPDPVFECALCGWTGKTEPALKRHMTMRHGDDGMA